MDNPDNLSAARSIFWIGLFSICGLAIGGVLTLLIGFKATVIAFGIALAVVLILLRILFILAQHWSVG